MKRMVVANSKFVWYTGRSINKGLLDMKKRLVSALLCVGLLAAMLPCAFAASDLDGHWAKTYIEYLDQEGVINPSATTGKYEPDRDMTRAEFMRYVNRAFHFTEKASISYSDVKSNAWYYETIQIAKKYGYISGVDENRMDPDGKMTREQAAVIIGRLFKADPGNISPSDLPYSDRDQIASWSAGYIKAASDKGFLTGYADGTFQPDRVVTRGEVAKILYYYMGTSLSVAGKNYTGADLKSDTTNVTISESCTLSDAVIQGDLYITEGLGSAEVTLRNVTVEGSIIVSGGTVNMLNTASDHVIVSSPMGRLLQVTATGATRIGQTDVVTAAALYEQDMPVREQDGFVSVTVNGDGRVSLTLDAHVTDLMLVGESTVSTTADTQIYRLQVQQPASVTGYGEVYYADIQTSGVSFASSVIVPGYDIAEGESATIGGQSVSGSQTAGVLPEEIEVDLTDKSVLESGISIRVPLGTEISSLSCDGRTMKKDEAYAVVESGANLSGEYLAGLSAGNHTLTVSTKDGKRASIKLIIKQEETEQQLESVSFDRYYRADGFRDVRIKLDGVSSEDDLGGVVLGMSALEYEIDDAGMLVLRRGTLAGLRAGTYTVSADLQAGGAIAFNLRVTDSTPAGTYAIVAEYNTFAPEEASFALPQGANMVQSVTVTRNGTTTQLQADTDFRTAAHTLTLTQTALEKFRQGGGLVEFDVTLSNGTAYTLVVDYIA